MEPEAPSQGATFEFCYRHPQEVTGVHCTRCGRPICPECMIPAPVGYQCPECVAEARKAFRQGPVRQIRTVSRMSLTNITLAILIAIWIVQVMTGQGLGLGLNSSGGIDKLFIWGGMQPVSVAAGDYYRLFTAMFLHLSLLHILFNGWALLIFGRFIEQTLGRTAFAVVFLLGGLCGNVASYLFGPPLVPAAGASGAIFALFGAFIAYNFRRRQNAQSRANLQSAIVIIGLNLLLTLGDGQIDWRAHLGGLIGGLVLGAVFDGIGARRSQNAVKWGTVAGIAVLLVVLVVFRTHELQQQFASLIGAAG
ncbi:MAG TPA: rhomboid family intramembrane serine protease [Actinomycetota bacterium]|nr:rhomboid family intramembrane serine protease [Actinomycetota bacterium]